MVPLEGARVLVVGGSSGIGLAAARAARNAGAVVSIAARSVERLAKAAQDLGGVRALPMDVTDTASVAAVFAELGEVDHVVITSGRVTPVPVLPGSLPKAMAGFDAKFWGAYRVAAHARFHRDGSLTLVSGVYADRPAKGAVNSSCTNAAVEALARGLALELAPVRVNAVSPGLIDTPLWDRMAEAERSAFFTDMADRLPLGRIGAPEDAAEAILGCMTNRFMTGSVVVVDGGRVLS